MPFIRSRLDSRYPTLDPGRRTEREKIAHGNAETLLGLAVDPDTGRIITPRRTH